MNPSNEEQTNEPQGEQAGNGRISQGFGGPEPARDFSESVRDEGKQAARGAQAAAERGKQKLAEGAQGIATALHHASDGMRSDEQEDLARFTDGIATKIEQLSSSLKDRDLTSMVRDVTRFAERQPALFLGGAFTAGLIAARFFKSTQPQAAGDSGGA